MSEILPAPPGNNSSVGRFPGWPVKRKAEDGRRPLLFTGLAVQILLGHGGGGRPDPRRNVVFLRPV